MKTKKRTIAILLISLLASLCLLCFGIGGLKKAYAEEVPITESTVTPDAEATKEDKIAEDWNSRVKSWLGTIFGGASVALDSLLIVFLSKKKKQTVAVTVNDSNTQEKLASVQAEQDNLKRLLLDMFQLSKGTLNVLLAIYADNKSVDENIRDTIKSISMNSEEVLKDVSDIINADTHKAVKTTLQNISNIVLG